MVLACHLCALCVMSCYTGSHLWLTGMRDPQSNLDSHTIILLQPLEDKRSRTFLDFETVGKAVDGGIPPPCSPPAAELSGLRRMKRMAAAGVCGLFEKRLKELNPTKRQLTYDVQGAFVARQHAELCCSELDSDLTQSAAQTSSTSSTTCRT